MTSSYWSLRLSSLTTTEALHYTVLKLPTSTGSFSLRVKLRSLLEAISGFRWQMQGPSLQL